MSKENEQIKELQARVHNLECAICMILSNLECDIDDNDTYGRLLALLAHRSKLGANYMIDIEEGK